MVVFTCNHCGDSVHKPKVEKHYNFACRNRKSLTCVDCFKDFRDEEYVSHTKCITEEERYAAKGSLPNGVVKKGEVKQESWMEMIKTILDQEPNLRPTQKNMLESIAVHNNVPRKKTKFLNFIKSLTGGRGNMQVAEEIWDILERYKNRNENTSEGDKSKLIKEEKSIKKNKKTENQNMVTNGTEKMENGNENEENESVKKKKKKKKLEVDEEPQSPKKPKLEESLPVEDNSITTIQFNFEEKILSILTSKESVSLKKLQKKVVKAYLKYSGEKECSPKFIKKFNKRLKKIENIQITDDKVSLKSVVSDE